MRRRVYIKREAAERTAKRVVVNDNPVTYENKNRGLERGSVEFVNGNT